MSVSNEILRFTALSMLLSTWGTSHALAKAPESSPRFNTSEAMQLANEEILIFSCGLPYKSLGSTINADAYWYSLYNMGNLVMNAGMGVHMVNAPVGRNMSKMNPAQFPQPKDFMMHKMKQFMMRTGLAEMPKNPYPVYLPFASGNPSFLESPNPFNFATLRWDPMQMDQTLTPAAIGQTVTKQVLWAEDFFSSHRGQLLGKTPFDGFRGGVLTALALNALMTFKDELAYDGQRLGQVDPMNYDPMKGLKYFPHAVQPHLQPMGMQMPSMLKDFKVLDKESHLFDQASLLWASSEFYHYSDPSIQDSYDAVFGDEQRGALFPADPHRLSKGISAVLLKNLMAMHYNGKHKVLVSRSSPGRQGHWVDTAESGMLATALENAVRAFHNEPMLKKMASDFLRQQADFLMTQTQNDAGLFATAYDLGAQRPSREDYTLAAQANGLKTLVLAYKATQDTRYLQGALRAYAALKTHFWSDAAQLFKASINDDRQTTLTPGVVAATLGGLRELALVASDDVRADAVRHMTLFFNHSVRREDGQGLQLAEMAQTGEMIPEDEMGMVKMTLQMKQMMKMPEEQRMTMMMEMRDADEDGVPNPMFAGGKYGIAPVVRSEIQLDIQ